MTSFWQGDPIWPEELSSAVAERLAKCKMSLIDYAVEQVQGGNLPGDGLSFARYLELEEKTLAQLLPHQAERARQIGRETEADIEALLTDDQQRTFREVGFHSLLARFDDSSWNAELSRKVEPLLTEDDRKILRVIGLRAVFSGISEGNADAMRKLNELPVLADSVREDYSDYFCSKPFEYADVGEGGKLNLCCALWLPEAAGDYKSGTFMEVWNSEKAQAIRQSILDGSYSYCIEQHCPHLQNKTLPKRNEVQDPTHRDIIDNNRIFLEHGPRTVVLSYDKSCNLACPTCRIGPIMLTGAARTKVEEIQEWATGDHLIDARQLDVTLSGDAFGSPVFFKLLREFDASRYPDLRISLCTNGLLLTERNWNLICNEAVDVVYISIDAATPETYKINRGGDFDRLKKHLHFVGELRSRGDLKSFIISFVVQANNFREMPAFASLGRSIHADVAMFIQVGNTGVFSNEEYDRRAVHRPSHPEHSQLLEVLQDPRLDHPIVDLRNFDGLRVKPDFGQMLAEALSASAANPPNL